MDTYGIAIAGVIAPCVANDGETDCASARARAAALGIEGLVFFTGEVEANPPPSVPSNVSVAPTNPPQAGSVTITWDANPENDIAGYRLYQRTASGAFGPGVDLGNVTQTTVTNLPTGEVHIFAVTAVDTIDQESGHSVEVRPAERTAGG